MCMCTASCTRHETTVALCAAEGAVRLVGGAGSPDGSAEYGRLEVAHRGGWGTVCDRLFTRSGKFVAAAADVVCKELGFTEGFRMQTVVRAACCMLCRCSRSAWQL